MKILVLGGGLMGPAAAYQAMSNPAVTQVIINDVNQEQLSQSVAKLGKYPAANKLGVVRLDLNNQAAAIKLMSNFDAIVAALPKSISLLAIQAALQAGTPLVDLSKPNDSDLPPLRAMAQETEGLVILACGLEPGLTEIMARHLTDQLDQVDELHIKCGGVPEIATPPLGYKIVFGGRHLPLRESEAQIVQNGQLESVPRYSGTESVMFSDVGECEAWHEGFMPWLLDLPKLKNLKSGSQKTIRWPGYAAKVNTLKEMGLLSTKPVLVDGVEVIPKHVLDALLYPQVKLNKGERDITLFKVNAIGRTYSVDQKSGQVRHLQAEMIDYYDETLDFTSMARTTAFTGAIVAQMIAGGDLKASGVIHPEQVIYDALFDKLSQELAAYNITFQISEVVEHE